MTDYPPRLPNVNLNRRSIGWIVAIFIGVLLIAVLWLTSYYTVGADSQGVVLRFGKFFKNSGTGAALQAAIWDRPSDCLADKAAVEARVRFFHLWPTDQSDPD